MLGRVSKGTTAAVVAQAAPQQQVRGIKASTKARRTLYISNPANGQVFRELDIDTPSAILRKFDACKTGRRQLLAMPLEQRKQAAMRFADLLEQKADDLGKIMTSETGKPITQSIREVKNTKERVHFFVKHVDEAIADKVVMQNHQMEERITREPLGIVANISAWNYPYFVGSNVYIPALLTGNGVMYKPSEHSTLSGREMEKMLIEAGFPEHAFKCLIGGPDVGADLLRMPIDGVFFTGSYQTGKRIYEKVSSKVVKVQLELGGKDPVYVHDDVDVASVAAATADGAMYNAGQSCCAVERIYVHEKIYDKFVEAFVEEVKKFKVGDPMDPETYIGPLTRARGMEALEAQILDAKNKGAKILTGGHRIKEMPGNYFAPTVVTDVTHSMSVMREESFGPIIGIMKVKDHEQARVLFEDNQYGLTAAVYSKNWDIARDLLTRTASGLPMPFGTVYWNCCDRVSPRLPWSGRSHSGLGLTLGVEGITQFTQPKAWHIKFPTN